MSGCSEKIQLGSFAAAFQVLRESHIVMEVNIFCTVTVAVANLGFDLKYITELHN